ncbi:hypothetical protein OG271_03870 [Micromonospora rifamycinica]|uniref:hypothetical protein n=1 Tax=Micromonospora rifamycinica TaxID=291594 RepID=UPI002E28DA7A|nr:hypothetical protein [Micromonospora rifamycinica]
MPAADRTLQLIADTLAATEAPAMTDQPRTDDRIPLRTELSTAGLLDHVTRDRDEARTDLGQALAQLTDAWAALNAAGYAHPVATVADLIRQCAADRDAAVSQLNHTRTTAHALEVERDDLRIQLHRAEAEARAMMRDRDAVIVERDQARATITAQAAQLRATGTLLCRLRDLAEEADRAWAEHDTVDEQPHVCDPIECGCELSPADAPQPANDAQGEQRIRCTCDAPGEPGFPHRPWCATQHQHPGPDCAGLCEPSPGSAPARVQGGQPAGYEVVVTALHQDGLGALRSGDVAVSAVVDQADGATATEALAQVLRALGGPETIRPADWERDAIDAARDAVLDARLAGNPAHADQLAGTAVRAIIDAGLAGAGGRCSGCGRTFPRTPHAGSRCWTCATEDQTGLDEPDPAALAEHRPTVTAVLDGIRAGHPANTREG